MSERWRSARSGIHVVDNSSSGSKVNQELVCPKPSRPSPSVVVSSFLPDSTPTAAIKKPSCPSPRIHCSDGDVGFEILDIFLRKASYGETANFGCSPPYFCGSPPSRAGNPLIHDVQFLHQRSGNNAAAAAAAAASSPLMIYSQQHKSPPARPPVRVEGFVPSGPDSRSVSALA